MTDTGYKNPGSCANYNDGGTTAWSNPTYAATQNDSYASAAIDAIKTSQVLKCYNFGFSIPSSATIVGILVERDAYRTSGSGEGGDIEGYLMKSGSKVGANLSAAWISSDTDTYYSYGGSTYLWGTTWTPAEINDSGFGFWLKVISDLGNGVTFYVDHIRCKVYYSLTNIKSFNTVIYASIKSANTIAIENIKSVMGVE